MKAPAISLESMGAYPAYASGLQSKFCESGMPLDYGSLQEKKYVKTAIASQWNLTFKIKASGS